MINYTYNNINNSLIDEYETFKNKQVSSLQKL